ncbi:hypothetical protein J1N35_025152, partial [Gossypium stocksii]
MRNAAIMFQFVKKRCRFHEKRPNCLHFPIQICPIIFTKFPTFFPPISPSCCSAIFFPNFPPVEINFHSSLRHYKRKLFTSSLRVLIFSPLPPLETSVHRVFRPKDQPGTSRFTASIIAEAKLVHCSLCLSCALKICCKVWQQRPTFLRPVRCCMQ